MPCNDRPRAVADFGRLLSALRHNATDLSRFWQQCAFNVLRMQTDRQVTLHNGNTVRASQLTSCTLQTPCCKVT